MALTKVSFSMIEDAAVNVADFGALGDGSTNDAAAIQAAVTAAEGKTLYFPQTSVNIYRVATTITLPSYINIVFDPGVTIRLANAANCAIFTNDDHVGGNTNITMLRGVFDSNKANQSANFATLDFRNVTNCVFQECVVMGSFTVGYVGLGAFHFEDSLECEIINCKLSDAGSEGLYFVDCSDMTVTGGEYYDNTNGSGCALTGGTRNSWIGVFSYDNAGSQFSVNGTFSKVLGCTATGSTVFGGIALGDAGHPGDYSIIDSCQIADCVSGGIGVQGATQNAIISNNVIFGTQVGPSGGGSGITVSDSSSNITVSGNSCVGNAQHGIFISTGINSNVVTNNLVRGSDLDGIHINSSSNCVIDGNTSLNNTGSGIFLSAGSQSNIVTNNRCYDTQSPKTQTFGVYSVGAFNQISGNFLAGNLGAGLEAFSAGETLANNTLSVADGTLINVTLAAGTSTVVTNANIQSVTRVSFVPTSANAISRGVFKSAQGTGSVTFTHSAGGASDTIQMLVE
jgi:parallel beta-helix repeat protein